MAVDFRSFLHSGTLPSGWSGKGIKFSHTDGTSLKTGSTRPYPHKSEADAQATKRRIPYTKRVSPPGSVIEVLQHYTGATGFLLLRVYAKKRAGEMKHGYGTWYLDNENGVKQKRLNEAAKSLANATEI